ncbi:MAG: hypothetical protein EOM69_05650 [Clostridia bacterium]|nr:hypothetical protein [Clostridia bacterium]
MKKTLSLVLTAMLALAMIPAAFAQTTAQDTQPAQTASTDSAAYQAALDKYNAACKSNQLSDLKTELDAMVAAGQLTQEEADTVYNRAVASEAMDKYRNAKRENNSSTTALKAELDAMVAAGQLTQEEADALYQNAAQNAACPNGRNEGRGKGGRSENGFGGRNGMNGAKNGSDAISSSTPSSSQQP